MKAVRLVIEGRVQGVGFRAWVECEARARDLTGFVRNRGDGAVEAVLCGDGESVEELMVACNRGPRLAHVRNVRSEPIAPEDWPDFSVLPTN